MDQVIEFVGNHALLAGGFAAVLGLLVYTEVMQKLQGLKQLTPALAVPWMNDPDAVVIDISPAADFNKGHIVDARNIHARTNELNGAETTFTFDRRASRNKRFTLLSMQSAGKREA